MKCVTVTSLTNKNAQMQRDLDMYEEGPLPRRSKPGPAPKCWESLTPRAMKKASDPVQKVLLRKAEERDVDPIALTGEVLFR